MYEVSFERVTVSKVSRYVILLKNHVETKRTAIAEEYTSSPSFPPLPIDEIAGLEWKLCEAGLDRKIRVVGIGKLPQEGVDLAGEVIFQGEVRLEQEVEGKMVCVGLMQIRITPRKEYETITDVVKKMKTEVSQMAASNVRGSNVGGEEEEDDYELHPDPLPEGEDQDDGENEDELRVEVHCGLNFFLGSQFHVQAQWGNSIFRTRSIKDKITPIWAQGGRVNGNPLRPITISVKDSKGNILESLKFSLSTLRTLFPYHIRLLFREEYLGAIPELYLSLVRESPARHSITEMPLKFGLRDLGQPVRNPLYLMVSLDPVGKVPSFMTLDRSQLSSLDQANVWLTSRSGGEEARIDLIGLSNNSSPSKGFSIFKSYLSRKIYMNFLMLNDPKSWFAAGNWESARVIEGRNDLSAILKKVYYQGQPFTIKKMLEFFNPQGGMEGQEETKGKTAAQRWKLLSRNYILRSKMVQKSTQHIQELQSTIEAKGLELVQIKKLLNEIKSVNFTLVGKEKMMTAIRARSRSGKIMVKQIDAAGLISALYQKQAILQGQKRINGELSLRMESLTSVQENQQDLLKSLTQNSSKLLGQQVSITRMKGMQQAIKQQRMMIGQLQRIFQKSEMDKGVNQALREQRERLEKIREKKQGDLKRVYTMVKENNQLTGNLRAKVKHAEETLVKLNEQYARLTSL